VVILLNNNLLSQKMINILKEYRNELIISKISYRLLRRRDDADRRMLKEILSFDNNNFCFGDYTTLDIFMQYMNFGIFIDEELIGYFGFHYHDVEAGDTYVLTMLIKDNYRNCKIGDVVMKQMIYFIFDNYDEINNLYASVLDENYASQKLVTNNLFCEINNDDILFCENAFLPVNGELKKCNQYVLGRKQYSKERYKRYKNINIVM